MHTYVCVLVGLYGHIYFDHCFEFECMGQCYVVDEKYSGGYILCLYRKISWCCNRRVSNVCQPSLLWRRVPLVRRWSCSTHRAGLKVPNHLISVLPNVFSIQTVPPPRTVLLIFLIVSILVTTSWSSERHFVAHGKKDWQALGNYNFDE